MASSIIHLAVTNELTKKYKFRDTARLEFGACLPDAGKGQAGHLKKSIWGGNKRVYDFEFFRSKFGNLMKSDDLYLGYYLHLVQDICYRHFVYDKYKWNPRIPGNVERLHNDYAIINHYVAVKYGLTNDLTVPDNFEQEKICEICEYDIHRLMTDMERFFTEMKDEEIFFFTREMADEYISEAVEYCMRELSALDGEGTPIESYENAWDNNTYSLLETTQNTRDLGGYRIDGSEEYTKYGRIVRSDAVIFPSEKDIEYLREADITTIIDLRIKEEVDRKPHGLSDVDGFDYHNLSIYEGSGIPESVEAVPASYFKIAHDPNMTNVFKTIAEAKGGVLFGCSAGKDRSGVTAALLLWLCRIRKSDIVYDYMRTKENCKERFDLIRQNFPDIDMNIVIPNENNMYSFMEMIEREYGSVSRYFAAIGIDEKMQEDIRGKITNG